MRDKTQEISLEVSFFSACRSEMTPMSWHFGTRMANSVHELNEDELFDHAFLIHTDRCDTMAMNY